MGSRMGTDPAVNQTGAGDPSAVSQDIVDLFDAFTHSTMERRTFMRRLSVLAGGAGAAAALVPLLEGSAAQAAIIPENDKRLNVAWITYDSPYGPMKAYTVRQKSAGKQPAVLAIHENRGLNPHIQDIARRLALAGYYAMAVDALSPLGGTPPDSDKARKMIYTLDRAKTIQAFSAGIGWLKTNLNTTEKVGCVGFCWGGGLANQLAIHSRDLDAAAVFYGASPNLADVPKIKAALLLNYAGKDARINESVPAYVAALKAAGVNYRMFMYEGANHAFNNDTRPARYDKAAADLAWSRTIEFFKAELG